MLFLNILIRDLILFYSKIKLNYKRNILIITLFIFIQIYFKINLYIYIAILIFISNFYNIFKKNIAIGHYNKLKFALIRYELVIIYQIISYLIIFAVILIFLAIFAYLFN